MNMEKKIKIDGIKENCMIKINNNLNIVISIKGGVSFNKELKILKFMKNYIIEELNKDKDMCIMDFVYRSMIKKGMYLVFNLKVLEYC